MNIDYSYINDVGVLRIPFDLASPLKLVSLGMENNSDECSTVTEKFQFAIEYL